MSDIFGRRLPSVETGYPLGLVKLAETLAFFDRYNVSIFTILIGKQIGNLEIPTYYKNIRYLLISNRNTSPFSS